MMYSLSLKVFPGFISFVHIRFVKPCFQHFEVESRRSTSRVYCFNTSLTIIRTKYFCLVILEISVSAAGLKVVLDPKMLLSLRKAVGVCLPPLDL